MAKNNVKKVSAKPKSTNSGMDFPANVSFAHQRESSRLWVLFTIIPLKHIILIPHLVALMVLMLVAAVFSLVGALATLITGEYPKSLEDFIVGVMRWNWRVKAYVMCMTDKYPPFSLK